MNFHFEPKDGLIIVRAELHGPSAWGVLRLALDTGATKTLISATILRGVGYDPARVRKRIRITTGSAVEVVPRISVGKVAALGHESRNMPVICHTLPPSANIDGLLGLDFLRGRQLTIDFRKGILALD